jgi:hypothetical protein
MNRLWLLFSLFLVAWTPLDGSRDIHASLTADGILPPVVEVTSVVRNGSSRLIHLRLEDADEFALDEWTLQEIHSRHLASTTDDVAICLAVRGGPCLPLNHYLPQFEPVAKRPWESANRVPRPADMPVDAPGQHSGFLANRSVYVSQSHGWTWIVTEWWQRWGTQRGNTWGAVEDFVNAEGINQYLVHYLRNAGAAVFTVRESDMQSDWVIVDDGDGAGHLDNGIYEEVGEFDTSTAPGFANFNAPYPSGKNPMAAGSSRFVYTTAEATAFARWTPDIPAHGDYAVYVSYAASANRSRNARYVVHHAGGETTYFVDQRSHGGTWIHLGNHYFPEGSDPATGSVVLHSDTDQEVGETVVSADAVRFGGGMGVISRGTGTGIADSPTSGRPRWEECSRYAAQFNGAPEEVYDYSSGDNKDDVGTRSRYAAWQHEAGEDAVYVSWHTNAPNPGVGTSTYVYGPNEPNGDYIFTGIEGSDVLAEFLHNEIVQDIRSGYDEGWTDRGIRSAWFGELNPSHNDEMPSALVEVAFHDTESDCLKLQDPQFRQLVARSFYQAIVKYFAWKDGIDPVFLPESPTGIMIETTGPGTARLSWQASPVDEMDLGGHAADNYRIYRSLDGRAFDSGIDVGNVLVHELVGLSPDTTYFFRISATNAGGESFTSPVVAIRQSEFGQKGVLIVGAFDRLDRHAQIPEDLSPWDLGIVNRMVLSRMNRFDYMIEHAAPFEAQMMPFDSAWHDADLPLDLLLTYSLVDWWCGEDSTEHESLSDSEQALLADFVDQGGRILLSGSEIGWDLVEKGSASDQASFGTLFQAQYLADDAESYAVVLPSGLALSIDDGTMGTYDVDYPDVIGPIGQATTIGHYNGDPALPAGTAYRLANGAGAVLLGFPLEAVYPAGARNELLGELLDLLEVLPPVPPVTVEEPLEPDVSTVVEEPLASDVLSADTPTPGADLMVNSLHNSKGGGCRTGESRATPLLSLLLVLLTALLALRLRDAAFS